MITNLRMELFEALVDMAACIYTIYLPRCAQPRPVLADLHAAAAWQGQGPLRGGEARGAAPRPAHQPPPGGAQQRGHQPRIHRQPQQRQPPALRLAQGRNITKHFWAFEKFVMDQWFTLTPEEKKWIIIEDWTYHERYIFCGLDLSV